MKNFIKNLFSKNNKKVDSKILTNKELEIKAQKGITFTIKHYGEALKDLARYDKGEKLVN